MINEQWKTQLRLHTDAEGQAAFRGFKGKCPLEVRAGRARRLVQVALESDRDTVKISV